MSNKLEEIYNKMKELLFADPEVKEKWDDLIHVESVADFLKSFKLVFWLVKKVVYVIEFVQAELGSIEKEERIELAVKLLDDIIVFKGWAVIFEPFDGFVFKLLISAAVNALDDKFGGGSWFKVPEAAAEIDSGNKLVNAAVNLLGE